MRDSPASPPPQIWHVDCRHARSPCRCASACRGLKPLELHCSSRDAAMQSLGPSAPRTPCFARHCSWCGEINAGSAWPPGAAGRQDLLRDMLPQQLGSAMPACDCLPAGGDCGMLQGLLTVFDYIGGAVSHVLDMRSEIRCLVAHAHDDLLAVGLGCGTLSLVEAKTGRRTDTTGKALRTAVVHLRCSSEQLPSPGWRGGMHAACCNHAEPDLRSVQDMLDPSAASALGSVKAMRPCSLQQTLHCCAGPWTALLTPASDAKAALTSWWPLPLVAAPAAAADLGLVG